MPDLSGIVAALTAGSLTPRTLSGALVCLGSGRTTRARPAGAARGGDWGHGRGIA